MGRSTLACSTLLHGWLASQLLPCGCFPVTEFVDSWREKATGMRSSHDAVPVLATAAVAREGGGGVDSMEEEEEEEEV